MQYVERLIARMDACKLRGASTLVRTFHAKLAPVKRTSVLPCDAGRCLPQSKSMQRACLEATEDGHSKCPLGCLHVGGVLVGEAWRVAGVEGSKSLGVAAAEEVTAPRHTQLQAAQPADWHGLRLLGASGSPYSCYKGDLGLGGGEPQHATYADYPEYATYAEESAYIPVEANVSALPVPSLAVVGQEWVYHIPDTARLFSHAGGAPLNASVALPKNEGHGPGTWLTFDQDAWVIRGTPSAETAAVARTQTVYIVVDTPCGVRGNVSVQIRLNSPPDAIGRIERQVAAEGKQFLVAFPLSTLFVDNEGDSLHAVALREVAAVAQLNGNGTDQPIYPQATSTADDFPHNAIMDPAFSLRPDYAAAYASGFERFNGRVQLPPLEAEGDSGNLSAAEVGAEVLWLDASVESGKLVLAGLPPAGLAPTRKLFRVVVSDFAEAGPTFAHIDVEVSVVRDCEVGAPGQWGPCSRVCGSPTGQRNRTASIVTTPLGLSLGAQNCPSPIQTEVCNDIPCALVPTLALQVALAGVGPEQVTHALKLAVQLNLAALLRVRVDAVEVIAFSDRSGAQVPVAGSSGDATTQRRRLEQVMSATDVPAAPRQLSTIDTIIVDINVYAPPSESYTLVSLAASARVAIAGGQLGARLSSDVGMAISATLSALELHNRPQTENTAPFLPITSVRVPFEQRPFLVRLPGVDEDGDTLSWNLTALPARGALHQITDVFSKYGYEPMVGDVISEASASSPAPVADPLGRVVFVADTSLSQLPRSYGAIVAYAHDGEAASNPAELWLLSEEGGMTFSDFELDPQGWEVVQNGPRTGPGEPGGLQHEPFIDPPLDRYIFASDDQVKWSSAQALDDFRWYFSAPAAYLGRQLPALHGSLNFTLGSFEGAFDSINLNPRTPLVLLRCAACRMGRGVELAHFPASGATSSVDLQLGPANFHVPLTPSAWARTPESSLDEYEAITLCEMAEVLSAVSELLILGDHSIERESIALDNVFLTGGLPEVPRECSNVY